MTLRVDRGGKPVDITFVPVGTGKYDLVSLRHSRSCRSCIRQVTSLQPGKPGDEAGMHTGDVVMSADGERDVNYTRLIEVIKAHEDQPITIEVKRDGQLLPIRVTPRKVGDVVIIGAVLTSYEVRTIDPGPIEAFKMSLDQNWTWAKMIVQTLGGLFTRHTSVKQLMGPIAIADFSGMAAQQGWIPLFSLMAMISLNLGSSQSDADSAPRRRAHRDSRAFEGLFHAATSA